MYNNNENYKYLKYKQKYENLKNENLKKGGSKIIKEQQVLPKRIDSLSRMARQAKHTIGLSGLIQHSRCGLISEEHINNIIKKEFEILFKDLSNIIIEEIPLPSEEPLQDQYFIPFDIHRWALSSTPRPMNSSNISANFKDLKHGFTFFRRKVYLMNITIPDHISNLFDSANKQEESSPVFQLERRIELELERIFTRETLNKKFLVNISIVNNKNNQYIVIQFYNKSCPSDEYYDLKSVL